jgi:von Hippel-Lindau disease tumor supressor
VTLMTRLLWAIVALILLGTPSKALACTCAAPTSPPCGFSDGDVVFVGVVEHVDVLHSGAGALRAYRFRITETFANAKPGPVVVESDTSTCGVNFTPGVSYLVQGRRHDDGHITTDACSYTSPASDAPEEIAILRELQRGVSNPRVFGSLVEFLNPGPSNRATDPDLQRPMGNVKVMAIAANGTREAVTDSQGRFSIAVPAGTYLVAPILPSGLTSEKPYEVEVSTCSVMVSFIAMSSNPHGGLSSREDDILERKNCDVEPTMRSLTSEIPTDVRFVNTRVESIRLYWLDFEGHRQLYSTLRSGQSLTQPTFATHPWVATDENAVCLGTFLARRDPATATIK